MDTHKNQNKNRNGSVKFMQLFKLPYTYIFAIFECRLQKIFYEKLYPDMWLPTPTGYVIVFTAKAIGCNNVHKAFDIKIE